MQRRKFEKTKGLYKCIKIRKRRESYNVLYKTKNNHGNNLYFERSQSLKLYEMNLEHK